MPHTTLSGGFLALCRLIVSNWLGLAPNHKITGGKIKSRKTRPGANRIATGLRMAAASLLRTPTALGAFGRRMRSRVGSPKAITAIAHKLAKLVYRMLKYGEDYVRQGAEEYEAKYQGEIIGAGSPF